MNFPLGHHDLDDRMIETAEAVQGLADLNSAHEGSVHPFEARGLGKAPFRLVGAGHPAVAAKYGKDVMAECGYCGKFGISRVFYILSSDGTASSIGSDCIEKAAKAEPAIARKVADTVRTIKRQQARAAKVRADARTHATLLRLDDEAVRDTLAGLPHPKIAGKTLLDWAVWMANNAGATGKGVAARVLALHCGPAA